MSWIQSGRKIRFDGDFFTYEPRKTLRQNITRLVADYAREGETLTRQLTPTRTGETRESVHAVIDDRYAGVGSLFSKVRVVSDDRDAFIRARWLEGGLRRSKAAVTKQKIGLSYSKGKGVAGLVRMKQRPPAMFGRAYRALNKLKAGALEQLLEHLA